MNFPVIRVLVTFTLLLSSLHANEFYFEHYCQSAKNWQIIDLANDAALQTVEDISVPPGFGPMVLELSASKALLLAKEKNLVNGYLVVLWKSVAENPENSDGILAVRTSSLPASNEANPKFKGYFFSQNYKTGCQLRYCNPDTSSTTLIERPGIGLPADQTWNYTGWFWQKVKLENDKIYAKFWSAVVPEPAEWMLVTTHPHSSGSRFGLKLNSGRARIAYFKADTTDIRIAAPTIVLYTEFPVAFEGPAPEFKLFTNFSQPLENGFLRLVVNRKNKNISEQVFKIKIDENFQRLNIPAGILENTVDKLQFGLTLPLKAEKYEFQAIVEDSVFREKCRAVQKYIVQKDLIKQKLKAIRQQQEAIKKIALTKKEQEQDWEIYQIASEQASAFIDLALSYQQQGQIVRAERALEYAECALQRTEHFPTGFVNTTDFQLKFADVELSSEDFTLGDSIAVAVSWRLQGQPPLKTIKMRLALVDESNKMVLQKEISPDVPLASWNADKIYKQTFILSIPEQISDRAENTDEMPPVFTGWHYLAITVFESNNNENQRKPILLDNPEAIEFFPVGMNYVLKKVYVHDKWIRLERIEINPLQPGEDLSAYVHLRNRAAATREIVCHTTLISEAQTILCESGHRIKIQPNGYVKLPFEWSHHFVGKAKLQVRILEDNSLLTQAEKELDFPWPPDFHVKIERVNEVVQKDDEFEIPIRFYVRHPGGEQCPKSLSIRIFANKDEFTNKTFFLNPNQNYGVIELKTWPFWGDYRISGKFSTDTELLNFEQKIMATVVEKRKRYIFVNGEQFIVKGINVQSLYPPGRAKTAIAMKVLKQHGFNTICGEVSAKWQLRMAQQHNLAWMPQASFCATSSDSLFAKFETDPLGGMEEISRQMVQANSDESALLFWNSAGEITGEVAEILTNLYPCFKIYDPYNRPVVYANRNGEEMFIGQDLMGVRYEFAANQTALSRQPLIRNSILKAFGNELPIMFTAYNAATGLCEKSGVEAVTVLWHENLKAGMSGGFFSTLTDVPGQHPGLFAADDNLIPRKSLSLAFKKYHADVHLEAVKRSGGTLYFKITNVRPYTLRQIQLKVKIRDYADKFYLTAEIPPEKSITTTVKVPHSLTAEPIILRGSIGFVTHFGLKNESEFELWYPSE